MDSVRTEPVMAQPLTIDASVNERRSGKYVHLPIQPILIMRQNLEQSSPFRNRAFT